MSVIPHMWTMATINRLWGWWGWGLVPSESFALQATSWSSISPSDWSINYIWQWIAGASLSASSVRIYIQKKCVLKKLYWFSRWNIWSSEDSTLSIIVNWTTAYTVTSTLKFNANNVTASNTSLSIPLNAWDYICLRLNAPSRVTNPTSLNITATMRLDCSPIAVTWNYVLQRWSHVSSNPTASTQNFLYDIAAVSGASWWTNGRVYVPATWTIIAAYVYVRCSTNSSSEQFTYSIRKNDTTDYDITTTAKLDATSNLLSNTSMSVPVTAWDYINLKYVTPARVTAPTGIITRVILVIQRS